MKHCKMVVVILSLVFLTALTHAGGKQAFTQSHFDQLQAKGDVVLVDVYATWCPTCAKQQKLIKAYQAENPDKKLHVLIVDYDDDKKAVRQFKAPRQSTLVLYRGAERLWFSVAETRKDVIFAELDKAFAQ